MKTTESGGSRGYDAGKKIFEGRKRQLAVGVEDSLIVIGLHPAEVQDRDSAQEVILELRRLRQ